MPFNVHHKLALFLCFLACLQHVNAQNSGLSDSSGTDSDLTALTPLSTVDDVNALAGQVVEKIVAQHTNIQTYERFFANADHKALITALCQNEESNGDNTLLTRRNLIQTCLTKVASKNDVSALLDANIAPTLAIIQLRGWANTPEVTQAIETTLRQYQTNPPTPPVSVQVDSTRGIVKLATVSKDPAVISILDDTIAKAITDRTTPVPFLAVLGNAAATSDNEQIRALAPKIALAVIARDDPKFKTVNFIREVTGCAWNIPLKERKVMLSNKDFLEAALSVMKAAPSAPFLNIDLATLGDHDAFNVVAQSYDPSMANDGTRAGSINIASQYFLQKVVFYGSGDKLTALKAHCQDAVYLDGTWTLTMPGYSPPSGAQPAIQAPEPKASTG